ncbi:MAG TPA: hypothetical protein VNO70_09015 [Blastocatellia bacterium]|nr:hypothetical protein [Blastocatellia bacterium]
MTVYEDELTYQVELLRGLDDGPRRSADEIAEAVRRAGMRNPGHPRAARILELFEAARRGSGLAARR